jgi:Domain of unknown function (DUF1772)
VLVALDMGMAFCHALEMPMKMKVDGPLWLTFQHTLYRMFGPGGPGAYIEMGAILASALLAFLLRKRRPAFYLALAGAVFVAVAFFAVWLGFVNPVNAQTAIWTAETMPPDWAEWRAQWEYAHTARFFLQLIGFSLLLLTLLRDAPTGRAQESMG